MSTSAIALKTTKLRPLFDRVLVRVSVPKEVLKGGILIPETAVEKPMEGEVIAVGTGQVVNGVLVPLDVKVGDIILFGKYSGNEIEACGERLLMLRADEIFGIYYDE